MVADSTRSSNSTGQSTPTGTEVGRASTSRGIKVPLRISSGSMPSSISLAPTCLHQAANSLTFSRKVAQTRPFLPAPIEAGPPFSNPNPARTAFVVVPRVVSVKRAPTSGPMRPVYRTWRPNCSSRPTFISIKRLMPANALKTAGDWISSTSSPHKARANGA
ncbi:hypothetical protein D9M68_783340 [compost metagenome]